LIEFFLPLKPQKDRVPARELLCTPDHHADSRGMHLNGQLQGKADTDRRVQPGYVGEKESAGNGSEVSSNVHAKCHEKRKEERNVMQQEKRNEKGKESANMQRVPGTCQQI
jgi:hypothetical protein